MQKVFLHGFATNPDIWHHQRVDFAPELDFENIPAEAKRVAELITQDSILIGWSMGGLVAIELAVLAGAKLKALVLVSTTPKFVRSADFPEGLPLALLRRMEKRIEREGAAAFHSLVFKNGETVGLEHLPPKRAERELAELARLDLRPALKQITVPTLIIHGDRDEICLPAAAKFMSLEVGGCELEIISGVGHAPMIEAADQFNALLENFINDYA